MMKKVMLTLGLMLVCVGVFAQDGNPVEDGVFQAIMGFAAEKPWVFLVALGLLLLSEALSFLGVKANGVFQLLWDFLNKLAKRVWNARPNVEQK